MQDVLFEECAGERVGAAGLPEGLGVKPTSLFFSRDQAEKARQEMLRDFALVTEQSLSALLGVTIDTLQQWRINNVGPVYCKLGRAVFYRREDLKKWIDESVSVNPRVRYSQKLNLGLGFNTRLPSGVTSTPP